MRKNFRGNEEIDVSMCYPVNRSDKCKCTAATSCDVSNDREGLFKGYLKEVLEYFLASSPPRCFSFFES